MFINIILWIVFGGVAGWIATLIVGDDAAFGIWGNVLIGIAGAFLGGFIADRMGVGGREGAERPTSVMDFVWAVLGAVILLLILNLIF